MQKKHAEWRALDHRLTAVDHQLLRSKETPPHDHKVLETQRSAETSDRASRNSLPSPACCVGEIIEGLSRRSEAALLIDDLALPPAISDSQSLAYVLSALSD